MTLNTGGAADRPIRQRGVDIGRGRIRYVEVIGIVVREANDNGPICFFYGQQNIAVAFRVVLHHVGEQFLYGETDGEKVHAIDAFL